MKPAHTLNTWKVHTWAQVAQAVTWDDYALNSDGQVTVKATRGPVIVWGRRTGEGEDVPRLEAPTPSPLEVAAARVNLRPFVPLKYSGPHSSVRNFPRIYREWKNLTIKGFEVRPTSGFPVITLILFVAKMGTDPFLLGRLYYSERSKIALIRQTKLSDAFYSLCRHINYKRNRVAYSLALALRFILVASYRAYLKRRVRPVSRRARVPRPLYARPRPPSCPLAPPVTC